ncbi:MAG: Gfo/Idh/MocA family oxidoreductase, partial [Candidatus Hydrogenedentota bacterium]
SRRTFLAMGSAALTAPWGLAQSTKREPIRIAFIGVGDRGSHLLKLMLAIPSVTVPAICDVNEDYLSRGIALVREAHGNTPVGFSKSRYDYRRMLERDDVEAVVIATPSEWHAEMSIDAMNARKHVASEVPGARTIEECWNLVKACEKTKRHYMLLENCMYDRTRMLVMNMTNAEVFGRPYYGECSYIRGNNGFNIDGALPPGGNAKRNRFSDLHPTHSLGPVSKWMGINRGDRPVSLVSMMSKPASLQEYSADKSGQNRIAANIQWQSDDVNLTLIKTARDRMITLYYDTNSSRPISDFYLLQGTRGVYDSRHGVYVRGKSLAHQWENDLADYHEEYGDAAADSGYGGADFLMLRAFIEALREDRSPFVDVYDSATWSAVAELSAKSIRKGGVSVPFPDFTNGRWKA